MVTAARHIWRWLPQLLSESETKQFAQVGRKHPFDEKGEEELTQGLVLVFTAEQMRTFVVVAVSCLSNVCAAVAQPTFPALRKSWDPPTQKSRFVAIHF